MKNHSSLPSQGGPNSGLSKQARFTIIAISAIAFSLALSLYFLLGINDEPNLMASNSEPSTLTETRVPQAEFPHVPGKILLRIKPEFRSSCSAADIQIPSLKTLFQNYRVRTIRKNFPQAEPIIGEVRNNLGQHLVDLSLIYELNLDSSLEIPTVAHSLSLHPAVMYAEPRYIYDVMLTTNDTYLSYQWYLDTMHVKEAWDQTTGDTNIVIAIIDTGTDFSHVELDSNRVALNYADPIDGIDNDNDGYIDNFRGWDLGGDSYWDPADNDPGYVGTGPGMDHGVLVAGAACAEANNNKSIAGVGYHTRYLPLKASVNQSLGISYGMDAITYAADHNVDIINLSWGSGAFSSFGQNVVDYAAINKQCLLVAAAGNHHNNTFVYPASYKHVISTAAVQTADGAWKQNNGTGTTYNYLIDVSAPGRNIMTTTGGGGVWVGATGTSMAAPLMCAVAALVKAKYPNLNSIQAGEVVRTTAKNIYSQNPTLLERLGKGRIDALQALTQSGVKSVRLDTLLVQDGINDIPEPFDTLNITGKFINYLDPTQNLEIDISSPNVELVQVIQGSSTIGTMATGSFASTPTPLRIFIKKAVTTPTKIWLRFGISDGNYTDYQYHELIIYPNRIDLDANQVKTTINGSGNFGFVDYPGFQYGLGFQYNNNYNVIRDAGFLIGISASNVVDMVRNDFGERDTDFEPVMKPYATSPGTHADLEAHARFQDINGGTQTIGVDVSHNAYQYSGGGQTQYTIFEYVIRNTNNYPINDAYAGLYSQWSRSFYNCSDGKFLPASNAVVAKFTTASNDFYTGITLLTQHSINAYVTTESQFNFSSQAKFDALHYQPGSQSPVNGDVVEFISAGPFNLAAGDSAVVAFALLAAPDLPTFDVVATNAKQQYNCVIKNLVPSTDLGTDVILCEAVGLPTFDAGAAPGNSYLWSTGATTQTISPQAEGSYSVTVSNSYGCTAIDTVALFVRPLNNFAITSSNAGFYTGRTSNFEVDDPGNVLTSFAWDFGDGNTSAQASPAHVFTQPGQYTVTVVIDNGYCTKTLSYTLTVSIATSVQSAAGQAVKFFPNPVQDRLQFRMEYDYTGNVIIEIFDNSGKRVQQKSLQKTGFTLSHSLDLSGLAKGLYIVKARAGKQVFSDKIIKQ